jgi:rhodanese-related sulfurtransferase
MIEDGLSPEDLLARRFGHHLDFWGLSEGRPIQRVDLGDEHVLALWLALRNASAARLAEVERAAREYLGEEVETIGRAELIARLARGEAVLVDVRPAEEYAAGHIEGARSIPIDELERRLAELPENREVIAYCRGRFCAYANQAVRTLERSGRRARRLEEGWPEWSLEQQSSNITTTGTRAA